MHLHCNDHIVNFIYENNSFIPHEESYEIHKYSL
jgi:hypothetical protein